MLAEVVVSPPPTDHAELVVGLRPARHRARAHRARTPFRGSRPSETACPPRRWLEACRAPTGPPPGWSNSSSRNTACRAARREARLVHGSSRLDPWPGSSSQLTFAESGLAVPHHAARAVIHAHRSNTSPTTTNARRALVRRRRRCLELKSNHQHGGPTHSRERHTCLEEHDCIARSPSEPPQIRMIT